MFQGSLNIGQHKATKVLVRPSVIIEILNSFNRRDERQIRVIGTLLGVTKGNTVEVLVPLAFVGVYMTFF